MLRTPTVLRTSWTEAIKGEKPILISEVYPAPEEDNDETPKGAVRQRDPPNHLNNIPNQKEPEINPKVEVYHYILSPNSSHGPPSGLNINAIDFTKGVAGLTV